METGGKPRAPKTQLIIGKIYADWCGHCVALNPHWTNMKNKIRSNMDFKNTIVEFVEIGDTEKNKQSGKTVDNMINQFNRKHMYKSNQKLALDGGYPTLFKLHNGRLEYYKGDRNADSMYNWYTSGVDTNLHMNKNPNLTNKISGFVSKAKTKFRKNMSKVSNIFMNKPKNSRKTRKVSNKNPKPWIF
jgi:thiol-disulfide isomerase/thioredoxin